MNSPVSHIIVGVADMAPVRALWQDAFGLEVVAEAHGSDAELERLWNLPAGAVAQQLMLRTPGQKHGWLHFVRFAEPGTSVRAGAQATDLCPKNIDINCEDMPARVAQLQAAGYTFRSQVSEYQLDGMTVREVQMPAHDDINVVLIEVPDWRMNMTNKHYGGVTSFVVTVPDTVAEAAFYMDLFGHTELLHHCITGPEIEAVVGLPAGASLELRLTGDAAELCGRMELVSYGSAAGTDRFGAAVPPATGSLGIRIRVADVAALQQRVTAAGYRATAADICELLFGRCRVAQLTSPAGLRVEAFQLLDA